MRLNVRRAWGAIALLAALLAVSSCSRDPVNGSPTGASAGSSVIPVDEGTPRSGGVLAFGIDSEPDGFYPSLSQLTVNGHLIASSMLETLVVFDKDQQPQPYLAESVTPSDGASKWTFKLRPNITFHDGTPMNAAAAKANLDEQRRGAGAVILKPLTSINVVDELTFEVVMSQPFAAFPSFMASQVGYMIAPATIGQPSASEHPVGTGPFVFESWSRGNRVVTKRNPNYWRSGKPYLDSMEFHILTDPSSRSNALRSGDIQLMYTDDAQTIKNYQDDSDYRVVIDGAGDVQHITMNEGREPFDNINARKALVLATDSHELVEALGAGILQPTDQPFSEKNPFRLAKSNYPAPGLEAARRAVAQYTADTGKPLEFELMIFAGSTNLAIAQQLQQQWSAAGINAKIDVAEAATGVARTLNGGTQAYIAPNYGFPEADWQYIFWHSSFVAPIGSLSINFPHVKLPDLDRALEDGRQTVDPEKRKAIYREAVEILNDNYTFVWLYRYVAALVAGDNVRGLRQAEEGGFAAITPKTWYADLWLSAQ